MKVTLNPLFKMLTALFVISLAFSCSKSDVIKETQNKHQPLPNNQTLRSFSSAINSNANSLHAAQWYRFFNSSSGDHFYTTVNSTYQNYSYEGICAYVFSATQLQDSVGFAAMGINLKPILRYWNSSIQDHFYTTVSGNYSGYILEGTDGYVSTTPSDSLTMFPIYRYWSSSAGDHFYTTTYGSYSGYTYEGILGYALGVGNL